MDDFLAARPQVNAPRQGQVKARAVSKTVNPLQDLRAEVRTADGRAEAGPAPEVETVVANGRIRRIHIRCKCGEEIILHCDYPQ